jgi:hypothetical protein
MPEDATTVSDRERALRTAQKRVQSCAHHAVWLSAVNYRADPLDQTLVEHIIASVVQSIEWTIAHPEADQK